MSESKFIQEDIDFLGTDQKVNAETVKVGYIKNLDYHVKQQYENIYKRVIDSQFVLCFHCGNEVFAMVKRLHEVFEADQAGVLSPEPQGSEEEQSISEAEALAAKRTKRNNNERSTARQ